MREDFQDRPLVAKINHVNPDGVYEMGTVNGTKFIAEAKELGLSDLS